MATVPAKFRRQSGLTLMEVLLASALGLTLLSLAVNIMLSTQRVVSRDANRLYLQQSSRDILRFLSDDIRRAGYNPLQDAPLKLLSASSVIEIEPSSISYLYKKPLGYAYTAIKYDSKRQRLLLCSSTEQQRPVVNSCRYFYSLFDENRIEVHQFQVERKRLYSNMSTSLLSITLTVALVSDSLPLSMTITVFSRS